MSSAGDVAKPSAFPVVASVAQTYCNVFKRPRRLIVISVVPVCTSLTIAGIYLWASWWDYPLSKFIFFSLLVPASCAGFAWTRSSIEDRQPQMLPRRPWVTAYLKVMTCYVLWIPCVGSALLVGTFLGMIPVVHLLFDNADYFISVSYGPLAFLSAVTLCLGPIAWLFLALPLVETNRPASPLNTWKFSHGLRIWIGEAALLLTIIQVLITALCFFALIEGLEAISKALFSGAAFSDPGVITGPLIDVIVSTVILPFGTIVETALFAELMVIAFRHVTGPKGAQADIVERFE